MNITLYEFFCTEISPQKNLTIILIEFCTRKNKSSGSFHLPETILEMKWLLLLE